AQTSLLQIERKKDFGAL
ncbi:hypothetical protein NPIL_522851, partial [Nephila pilipes]